MDVLRVFFFGRFRVEIDGRELTELSSAKAQELFCYLLLNRERPHHREILASVLWENVSTGQSKQYLRRALWQLQSTLSELDLSPDGQLIQANNEWIQVNSQARVWVDAIEFLRGCLSNQGTPGQDLGNEAAVQLRNAIQLYKGNLLDGWYQEWCLFERERFRQIYLATLDKLMLNCEVSGEYEAGITYGMRILRFDQAREHTHRRLMRLFCLSGNRTDALRQYEKCSFVLERELGIKPSMVTVNLYEKIRAAQVNTHLAITVDDSSLFPKREYFMQRVYAELQQIRGVLINIHNQVQHQIEAVEAALDDRS